MSFLSYGHQFITNCISESGYQFVSGMRGKDRLINPILLFKSGKSYYDNAMIPVNKILIESEQVYEISTKTLF